MTYPVRRLTIKQLEMEWREYKHSLKEIEGLEKQTFETDHERYIVENRLRYLKEITTFIADVYEELDDMKRVLIDQRYWSRKKRGWMLIAARCFVSKRQAMRWRDEIMIRTANLLGAR